MEMISAPAPEAATVPDAARAAALIFGFSDDAEMRMFTLTENWTYLIDDGRRDPAVLRVYRPGGRPPVEIRSELAWLAALREEFGGLVPETLRTPQGAAIVEVDPAPPLEPCRCVLFSFAQGTEPPEDDLMRWFPTLGQITGRLHRHARAWTPPPTFTRPRWDLDTTLGEHPHWGPWHSSVTDPEERRQLQRLADVVEGRLRQFGEGRERFGLVHADLRLANLLVEGSDITVIDFDDCGFSWYLYDVACALTFNEGRPDVDELIDGWVTGYRSVESLSAEDEAEIPTFLMLRRLQLSAYVGLRADTELARDLHEQGFAGESCRLAERYLSTFG
jgi:Ser/Thr protein kinase RdoA (MazF antagonist)